MTRSRLSVKVFVKMYFRLYIYERRASPPWRDLAIDYQRCRLWGLEIFHINAVKRAGSPRRASKSRLRTHDKVCLGQNCFWITFPVTRKFCLFILTSPTKRVVPPPHKLPIKTSVVPKRRSVYQKQFYVLRLQFSILN